MLSNMKLSFPIPTAYGVAIAIFEVATSGCCAQVKLHFENFPQTELQFL
jgi:hypothetical protein